MNEELLEASAALVEALIRIETPGGMIRCRVCFQHGFPEQNLVLEHLSTCPAGRVAAAIAGRTEYPPGKLLTEDVQDSGDILSPEKELSI